MQQDVVVAESLFAHDGGSYLAQAYTVSPSGSGQLKPCGCSVYDFTFIYYKCRTEQVGGREGAPYLQFLTDNQRLFRTYDFQLADASRFSPLYGDEVEYLSVIAFGFSADKFGYLGLGITYFPAVEIGGFIIVVIQNLADNGFIVRMAEAFGGGTNPFLSFFFAGQVWDGLFFFRVAYRA